MGDGVDVYSFHAIPGVGGVGTSLSGVGSVAIDATLGTSRRFIRANGAKRAGIGAFVLSVDARPGQDRAAPRQGSASLLQYDANRDTLCPVSKPTPRPPLALLAAAHATLGGTNAELGALLSVSKRTVVRWYAKESPLDRNLLEKLARLVHPKQPALATEIADAMGTTLEYLGIVTPKPPPLPAPPPPPPDPTPPPDAIDGVVCVAAEAMDASPRPVRGALLAACVRARKLGYTLETLEQALTPAPRRRRSSP